MQEVHKSTNKQTNKISQNKSRDFDIVVRDIHTLARITDIVDDHASVTFITWWVFWNHNLDDGSIKKEKNNKARNKLC